MISVLYVQVTCPSEFILSELPAFEMSEVETWFEMYSQGRQI